MQVPTTSQAVQTEMTLDDLIRLEEIAAKPPPKTVAQETVGFIVTESDERINFYTGLESKNILQGNF